MAFATTTAALLALVSAAAMHATASRVNAEPSMRAHSLRGLQASTIGSAAAESLTSSSSSGSVANVFEVQPYAGACPSVRTLVSDCNATVQDAYYSGNYLVNCVVGPAAGSSSSSGDGSCETPYSPVEWFDSSATDASSMSVEAFRDVTGWTMSIDLKWNALTEFSPVMSTLLSLSTLDLRSNDISSFNSSSIAYISNIYLSDNKLREFVFDANDSYYLDVSDNELVSFELMAGYELSILDVSSNRLETMAIDPGCSLVELHATDNELQSFDMLGGFTYLKTLKLKNNLITAFDPVDFMPELEILDLSSNRLENLSLDFATGLVDLDASSNELRVFEACTDLDVLYSLQLQNNLLTDFNPVGEMPLLEILNLSSNLMTSFSLGWSYPVLSLIDVSNNSMDTINVWELSAPHGLFANNNSFSAFGNAMNLSESVTSLDLSFNQLADWTEFNPPTILMALFASNNGAVKLPLDLSGCDSLVFMDFSYNELTHINATVWPSNLRTLDLRGNPIEVFDIRESDKDKLNNLTKLYVPEFALFECGDDGTLDTLTSFNVQVCVYPDADYSTRVSTAADDEQSRNTTIILVSVLVGLLFTAAAIVVVALFLRQRRRLNNLLLQQVLEADPDSWPEDIRENASLMAMRIERSDLKLDALVRKTSIAEVWRGRFKGQQVTVKRIMEDKACEVTATRAFMEQIRLVDKLEHPKVVHHVGFTWNRLSDLSVVTQLLPDDSLEDLMRTATVGGKRSIDDAFSWFHCSGPWPRSKLEIAIDVAEALVFLHSFSPPIAHRDVRARNVFLDASWGVKLGEVGLRRTLDAQIGDGAGSIPWMAPELLREEATAGGVRGDERSDVYAFGAFLVELDTCQRPFAALGPHVRASVARVGGIRGSTAASATSNTQIVLGVSQGELQPPVSGGCPSEIAGAIDECLRADPDARPAAMKLHYDLRQLQRAKAGDTAA